MLNLRMPLAQLGQAAEVTSPSAAIEPAVTAGLVDWWPEEPTCPVVIRHLLVRDADLRRHPGQQAPLLHARAASAGQRGSVMGAPGSRPGPAGRGPRRRTGAAGRRGAARGRLGAGRHPPAMGLGHLPGPGRPGTAAADRGTASDTGRGVPRPGPARGRRGGRTSSPLRSCVLGTMAFSSGQLAEAEQRFSQALAQARRDPDSQPLAAQIASRLADTARRLGRRARGHKPTDGRRWAPAAWTRRPPAGRAPWSPSARPSWPARAPPWPSYGTWMPIRRGSPPSTWTA